MADPMTLCPIADKPTFTKGVARHTLRYIQRKRWDGPGRLVIFPCPAHHYHLGHQTGRGKR